MALTRSQWLKSRRYREAAQAAADAAASEIVSLAEALHGLPGSRNDAPVRALRPNDVKARRRLVRAVDDLRDELERLLAPDSVQRLSTVQRRAARADQRWAEKAGKACGQWSRLSARVGALLQSASQPLYAPLPGVATIEGQHWEVMNALHGLVSRFASPGVQDDAASDLGCYHDIPLPGTRFIQDAHAALRVALATQRRAPLRFMDVGCGAGVKLLLAAQYFDRVDGLEYDRGYVEAARQLLDKLGYAESQVYQADARTFPRFGEYDVLYFYQPMSDQAGLEAIERQIATSARPGTVLMAPYSQFAERAGALGCGHVEGHVYLAGTSAEEAQEVRGRAEWIGPFRYAAGEGMQPELPFVEPLLRALEANGYGI